MKKSCLKKVLCLLVSAVTLFSLFSSAFAVTETVFTLTSDVSADNVSLGDTITYTVGIENSPGIKAGTLFFTPSSSLTYLSSTLNGESVTAEQAVTGDFTGSYGIGILCPENPPTGQLTNYATITFTVTGLEDATLAFTPYQCITDPSAEILPNTVTPITHKVNTPNKPVITTESLDDGVIGVNYSFSLLSDFDSDFVTWNLSGGTELPSGLELLSNGQICGTPTVYGEFTFKVTASVLDTVTSDEKEFTLTVLEKPKELALKTESSLLIDTDNNYLRKLTDKMSVETVISQFESGQTVKIFSASGTELESTDYVGTGCTVSLMNGETKVDTLTVVLLGDTDGDGKIGTLDYQRIRSHYLKKYTLSGAYFEAGCVSGGSKIGTLDYQRVRSHYLKKYNLYA